MSQDRELWVNPATGQRYILPKGVAFESGDTPITSVNGLQWLVHLEEIEGYRASEAEVQMFMLADLRLALGSKPVFRAPIDSDSEDSSEWDSEDSESDDNALEQALSQTLEEGFNAQSLDRLLDAHPELSDDLLVVLDSELAELRQSFSEFGMILTDGNQPLTAPAMLRAFGERLIEQADILEAEQLKSTVKKKDT